MLNAVGSYSLRVQHLTNEESEVFELIIGLVGEDKFEEAEKASGKFPFDQNQTEVEPLLVEMDI